MPYLTPGGSEALAPVFGSAADTVGEFPLAPDGPEPGRDGLPRGEESWGSGPPRRIRRQYPLLLTPRLTVNPLKVGSTSSRLLVPQFKISILTARWGFVRQVR